MSIGVNNDNEDIQTITQLANNEINKYIEINSSESNCKINYNITSDVERQ